VLTPVEQATEPPASASGDGLEAAAEEQTSGPPAEAARALAEVRGSDTGLFNDTEREPSIIVQQRRRAPDADPAPPPRASVCCILL
jgi:hypothetical protein